MAADVPMPASIKGEWVGEWVCVWLGGYKWKCAYAWVRVDRCVGGYKWMGACAYVRVCASECAVDVPIPVGVLSGGGEGTVGVPVTHTHDTCTRHLFIFSRHMMHTTQIHDTL